MPLILTTYGWAWQIGSAVGFVQGGTICGGVVVGNQHMEGIRFAIIKLNDGSPKPVCLTYNTIFPILPGAEVAWKDLALRAADAATIWRWVWTWPEWAIRDD
ncbi:hypothetical protein FKP32DRAFT_1607424 [Trametes sanguinea]|nr:hypothetical protein FKP32DRAFT_1607424 [Trametes sanguinea]